MTAGTERRTRDLQPLFEPRSVAVVGASADPEKWGHGIARNALAGEHRRAVYLVNRNGGEILGRTAYRSVTELPEPPDLTIVAVGAAAFEAAVDDALARGTRALVGITAGLGETGPEAAARERALAERVRAAGAVLMGPNCLGIYDAQAELEINRLTPGPIGFISQSGNFALEVDELARDQGLGISRFASVGNQADLEVAELISAFAAHEPTRVIAVYCEDFRDGRAFARAALEAAEAGKPVVLLDAGRSAAGAAAARSHTGAMLSSGRAVEAACAAAGILRVSTPRELVDVATALAADVRAPGPRVAVLTDGGGSGVVACDVFTAHGFQIPSFSDELSAALSETLGPEATTRNPVDLAGAGPRDYWTYERAARVLLSSDEADIVVLTGYFGGYSRHSEDACRREVDVAQAVARARWESGRTLLAQTMYAQSEPARALRAGGVAVYREIEAAAGALATVARRERPRHGVPDLPPAATPFDGGYHAARELFAAAGVGFPDAHWAANAAEARAAADDLGGPLVLKALGLEHKSDAGGVVLGLAGAQDVERAARELERRLDPEGFSVERMVRSPGLELIVGALRDTRFGPIVLAGVGGVYAELLDDVAVGLAPVDDAQAGEMLRSLRGAPLLTGARGRAPLDISAAAQALAAVSRVAAEQPEVVELEINPLLVTADGAIGLDARVLSG
jgi:acetate---CoA ligase (ADP-forming)